MIRRFAVAMLFGPLLLGAAPAGAQAAACQFVLGFRSFHDRLPAVVGACVDNEGHNPANGDALQHTTKGLLVWRKADNWTAFTDGFHTWVNGPRGMRERLNTQRFSWEANPGRLPVVGPDGKVTIPPAQPIIGTKVADGAARTVDWKTARTTFHGAVVEVSTATIIPATYYSNGYQKTPPISASAGKRFVIFVFNVTNTGKSADTFSDIDLAARDAKGRTYTFSGVPDESEFGVKYYLDLKGVADSLAPGASGKFVVTYAVDAAASGVTLVPAR